MCMGGQEKIDRPQWPSRIQLLESEYKLILSTAIHVFQEIPKEFAH